MHGAHQSAHLRWVHEQSQCIRLHREFGCPWARSAIWRQWKHRRWEESKTAKEGKARISMVLAMRPGLAKIIERVRISRHFGRPESDLHIAENACCIDSADSWSSKRVHWLSSSQSTNHSTTYYEFESTVGFDTGVAWVSLPISRIHRRVAEESIIQWLLASLNNTGWMDHHQVHHGSFGVIPILNPVDVDKAYSYSESCYLCLQWHVRSYGWHYVSLS